MGSPIPSPAWSWPIGAGYEPAPRPRVATTMIDDGPWAGVPIGGIGAGSIGRTQRGDFARWHLRIGEHRFEPVAVDGFALWTDDGVTTTATVLRTTPPPRGWGTALAVGSGTYRALFPRAWFEYDVDGCTVRAVEEQLSPVIPGDDAASSLPVGTFEWHLTNVADRPVDAALLLSWRNELPAPATGAAGPGGAVVEEFRSESGIGFVFRPARGDPASGGSMAVMAGVDEGVEISISRSFDPDGPDGVAVWAEFASRGRFAVPPSASAAPGTAPAPHAAAAIAARVELKAGESRTIRFAMAWDLPHADFGGGRRWHRRYTREWGTGGQRAADIAVHGLRSIAAWRASIERWQAPVLEADDRPDWYKAALFNELYYLVDGGSLWTNGVADPDVGPATPAAIGLLECFDYPFYDTLDVHFYAAAALAPLWPALQASISRAYAATVATSDETVVTIEATGKRAIRKVPGALPHDLGGPSEDPLVRVNHYRFQEVNGWKDLNSKFVLQAWRDRLLDPDPEDFVRAVWPGVVGAMDHLARFDRDGDGLPEHDGVPDQTYDTWPMSGPSAYGGSLWLAALRAAAAFAREVGDTDRAVAWDADFERASASYEARLWNGMSYDYDASSGPSGGTVMADQLVGQWFADTCGLGDVVPPDHARSALERIFELNVCAFGDGLLGAVNGMRPDRTVDRSSEQSQEVWVGTTYALAAFMIGRGLVTEGWTTAEGAARVTYERGLWFRTPEAYDREGNYRASMYLRPLAIWAIEEALERHR